MSHPQLSNHEQHFNSRFEEFQIHLFWLILCRHPAHHRTITLYPSITEGIQGPGSFQTFLYSLMCAIIPIMSISNLNFGSSQPTKTCTDSQGTTEGSPEQCSALKWDFWSVFYSKNFNMGTQKLTWQRASTHIRKLFALHMMFNFIFYTTRPSHL